MVRIRTKREIEFIKNSCQIVSDTLDMLTDYVRPGVKITELDKKAEAFILEQGARPAFKGCLLYTSPSPRDLSTSRMPSSA